MTFEQWCKSQGWDPEAEPQKRECWGAAVAAEREWLAQLAESRADGWHSLTPAEIRAGQIDAGRAVP